MELEKIAFVYGDVCVRKKKQRRKRQKLLVMELMYDYAKNSTLHGLRYIVARGLHIIERLFWFITVIASIALCSIFIYNTYQKWITSPVIVTVNGQLTSVATVPFPSVTICPLIKVKPSVFNYTDALRKFNDGRLNQKQIAKLRNVAAMCEERLPEKKPILLANKSLVDDITEVAQRLHDVFFHCMWYHQNDADCSHLFSKVLTADGVCYTTNTLAASEMFEDSIQTDYAYLDSKTRSVGWSPDTDYDNNVAHTYPRRGQVLGSLPDMVIALIDNPNYQDESCNELYSGYKIYMQHPTDFPQSSLYYYTALPDQLTSFSISFNQLNTESSLSSYSPEIRQCYFPADRKLRYFKIYTVKNCQAECLSNYTFERCHCVGFYMPHDNSSQLCAATTAQDKCLFLAKDYMAKNEIRINLEMKNEGCRCLPACNTIEYDAEPIMTKFNLIKKLKRYQGFDNGNSYTRIDLSFKKPQFVTMQRRELFGLTDLLANVGGLLGLFLGFSFLSLIEMFYFLTLRVGFTLKRDLEEEKAKKKTATEMNNRH